MEDKDFGNLKWRDRWEGYASFPSLRSYGRILDAKVPPLPARGGAPDRSPTRRQIDAMNELDSIASSVNEGEATLLRAAIVGLAARATSPTPDTINDEEAPDEDWERWRSGTCDLMIDTGRKRSKPTGAQRKAWESLLERGDAFWDELYEHAFEAYQRQVDIRRRWWRAIYGEYLLDQYLPRIQTVTELKPLCRPRLFRIKPQPDKKTTSVDIGVHVVCTWCTDGFGATVRDGTVVEIGPVIDIVHFNDRPRQCVVRPVFGKLNRIPDDNVFEYINDWELPATPGKSGFENAKRVKTRPWQGFTRFDSLLDYANVADQKAEFAHDPKRADRSGSRMAWEFACGEFEVRVYATSGHVPSDAQAEAFASFRAREKEIADELLNAVFDMYRATQPVLKRNYKDRYVDDVVPEIDSRDGLRELIQLRHVHVHPADANGQVSIALQFVASYDYDGFSTTWQDGRIVAWGTWKDAEYRE
jgi:hypothetical protein